jgi:energy-coupling factor transport system permease protein
MGIFDYYEGDSFLHGLNPTVKIISLLIMMGAVILTLDPLTPALFLVVSIGFLWLLGRIRLLTILRLLLPFTILALSFVVFNALFYNVSLAASPAILARVGPFVVTREGLLAGISIGMRALCIVSFSIILIATTDPTDLVLSLIQQGHLGYRFGYGTIVAYRFLPLVRLEYESIRAAHRVRGVGREGGLRGRYQELRRYAIPLLASAIRRSERVAIALDSKAFGSSAKRTYYRRLRVGFSDWIFLVGVLLLTAALLYALAGSGTLRYGVVP